MVLVLIKLRTVVPVKLGCKHVCSYKYHKSVHLNCSQNVGKRLKIFIYRNALPEWIHESGECMTAIGETGETFGMEQNLVFCHHGTK